jgi:hypothetical protein
MFKQMSAEQRRFAVGDTVYERFPFASAKREAGTVIDRYNFGDQYRYVVRFQSGREEVFFEKEVLCMPQSE